MLRQQLSQESFYFWNNWNIWRLSRLPPKWVSITANASGQCLSSGTAKGLHQSWPSGKSPSTEVLHRGWGCGAAVPWSGWHTSVSQALHPASLALLKSSDTATNPALGAGNYCGHGADKDAMLYLAHRKPGLTCSKDTFAPWQLGAGQIVSVPVESRSSFPEHWPMDTMPLGAQAVLVEGLGLEVTVSLQEVSDGVCRLAIALLFAVTEIKCMFIPAATAKIWPYHCQAFGLCLYSTCRAAVLCPTLGFLHSPAWCCPTASDSQCCSITIKSIWISVLTLRDFLVPSAFPGGCTEEGLALSHWNGDS